MIRAGIIGASGYSGVELIRSILRHPQMELVYIAADSTAGKQYGDVYPQYMNKLSLIIQKYDLQKVKKIKLDVMFIALPHGESMPVVVGLLSAGIRVVDLGGDFRLKDAAVFETWYKVPHTARALLPKAVYGLPEKYRKKIKNAKLVANPGCYPTTVILGLWPIVAEGIKTQNIFVDAKSGTSGAGKKLTDSTHFASCNESVSAYKVFRHQHTPEIIQEVGDLVFVPHLIPMTRGIMATIYVKTSQNHSLKAVRSAYNKHYSKELFTSLMPEGIEISTKMSYGSNNCYLQVYAKDDIIIITSVIDNLVKGAAGQAIQNCNIMFGQPEGAGLEIASVYP